MQSQNKQIQGLIDYLECKLKISSPHWKKYGPRTFMYYNTRDTIFIYVSDSNLTMINDGSNVCDGIVMLRLSLNHLQGEYIEHTNQVYDHYLQEILALI